MCNNMSKSQNNYAKEDKKKYILYNSISTKF